MGERGTPRDYVLWLDQCGKEVLGRVGGKNANLGEMIKAGINVPPGFAITTDAYQRFLEAGGLGGAIRELTGRVNPEDLAQLQRLSREIGRRFESAPLPADIRGAICEAYEELGRTCGLANLPVAVRSSATSEDTSSASFAGQQETYLWVTGAEALLRSVVRCWASLYSERALAYRVRMNWGEGRVSISVGVQKMVNARSAGVMFTLNPSSGDRSKIVIDANWGLGESVVKGEVTPDNYVVDKVTFGVLARRISPKCLQYVPNPVGEGVSCQPVPPELQETECLTEEELKWLMILGKRIERLYGAPQDIEWAIDRDLPVPNSVMVLQSRPETVWSRRQGGPVFEPKREPLHHILNVLLAGKRIEL